MSAFLLFERRRTETNRITATKKTTKRHKNTTQGDTQDQRLQSEEHRADVKIGAK